MIRIYKIKRKDLPQFVSLWNQEYKRLTSSQFQMTLERAKKGYDAKMFDYYGLYNNDVLIGFMLLKENKDLWIKHLLIDKNFRRRGLGTLFLEKAKQLAKSKKINLKTEVIKENREVIKFFLKNRFKRIKFDREGNQYILKKSYDR